MRFSLIIFFTFLAFGFTIPKNMEKKIDKAIKTVFNINSFEKELIFIDPVINSSLPISFSEDNFYKIINNKQQIGYFYYGKASSKTDVFNFLVIFDAQLIIKKIKILAYREDYGMEIASNRWLNQFNDLELDDKVVYQKEIKAISGATISAKSMTKAVNDLLHSLSILQNKNKI